MPLEPGIVFRIAAMASRFGQTQCNKEKSNNKNTAAASIQAPIPPPQSPQMCVTIFFFPRASAKISFQKISCGIRLPIIIISSSSSSHHHHHLIIIIFSSSSHHHLIIIIFSSSSYHHHHHHLSSLSLLVFFSFPI